MSSNSGGQRFQVYGGRGRGAGRARTKSSAPAKVAPRALELVHVDTLIKAKSASAALMTEMVLALDCEGTALSRTGRLCLVQIASRKKAYLFDVIAIGDELFTAGGIGPLLESETIVKVVHDCRQDSDALYWQFNVKLANVFDTQVAYTAWREQKGIETTIPVGLKTLLRTFSVTTVEEENLKASIKSQFQDNPKLWEQRPLPTEAITYAKFDIEHLLNVYNQFKKYLQPEASEKVNARTLEYLDEFRMDEQGPAKARARFTKMVEKVQEEREAKAKGLAAQKEEEEKDKEGKNNVEQGDSLEKRDERESNSNMFNEFKFEPVDIRDVFDDVELS